MRGIFSGVVLVASIGVGFGQEILVHPYVQLGNNDQTGRNKGISIVWLATAPGDWSVKFKTRRESVLARVTDNPVRVPKNSHEVLSASFNRASAGETITYEVRLGTRVMATGVTRAPLDGAIRVAVVGDCGRKSAGQKLVAGLIRDQKPDMTLIVGDIVYSDGRMSEYRTNFFPFMDSAANPLMQTTLTVGATGNHDTAFRNLNKYPDGLAYYAYWRQPLNGPDVNFSIKGPTANLKAAAGGIIDKRANFSFDDGPVHWVILDSNTYVNWKRSDLRAWLEKSLRETRKPWKIVAFHHVPFHSSKKHEDDTFMQSVADIFTKTGVDLVMAGHVHNYQRTHPIRFTDGIDKSFDGQKNTHPKGPIYICTGAGGGELYDQNYTDNLPTWKPFTAAFKPGFGATFLDISSRRLTLTHLKANGTEQDRITIDKR